MKKLFLALIVLTTIMSCSSDDDATMTTENNTIIGRWNISGFDNTMYVFTETETEKKRYTIYSTDGDFGDLDTAIPNPNDWYYENEILVIDLNFGNFSRTTPTFRCNGNVVDLINDDGEINTTLSREGFDIETCN
jgi:hypothetical protein